MLRRNIVWCNIDIHKTYYFLEIWSAALSLFFKRIKPEIEAYSDPYQISKSDFRFCVVNLWQLANFSSWSCVFWNINTQKWLMVSWTTSIETLPEMYGIIYDIKFKICSYGIMIWEETFKVDCLCRDINISRLTDTNELICKNSWIYFFSCYLKDSLWVCAFLSIPIFLWWNRCNNWKCKCSKKWMFSDLAKWILAHFNT